MQSLEVISVNVWQILISLINLVILFLLFKKFLFKPVNVMLQKRQSEIDERYDAAEEAKHAAIENELLWNEKINRVKAETDKLLKKAQESAKRQEEAVISNAKEQAEGIVRDAQTQAKLEIKNAGDSIKKEIVEISTALANKLIEREINMDDHHSLIDSFIKNIGDEA